MFKIKVIFSAYVLCVYGLVTVHASESDDEHKKYSPWSTPVSLGSEFNTKK